MAIEEKIVSFEKLSRYDQQIKAYIDYELSQIETGADTSDATATEDKVFLDETFYAGGQKRTGTFTIESELDSQDELIASIKTALEGKTAGSGGDTLKTLLDATKSTYYMFNASKITTFEGLISYNATENVTNMSNMFYNCSNLASVPLFNTSNSTFMSSMFQNCYKLGSVPIFNTSKVTNMQSMFNQCQNITTVTIADVSNVTSVMNMFYACYALKKVVLEKISSKLTSSDYWFYGCEDLEVIHFKGATGVPTLSGISAFNRVPSTCKVVIPDALYDTWTNKTNWSAINVTWVKESEYTEE
jgi:surface protein